MSRNEQEKPHGRFRRRRCSVYNGRKMQIITFVYNAYVNWIG
jgi:hypothetical protein